VIIKSQLVLILAEWIESHFWEINWYFSRSCIRWKKLIENKAINVSLRKVWKPCNAVVDKLLAHTRSRKAVCFKGKNIEIMIYFLTILITDFLNLFIYWSNQMWIAFVTCWKKTVSWMEKSGNKELNLSSYLLKKMPLMLVILL